MQTLNLIIKNRIYPPIVKAFLGLLCLSLFLFGNFNNNVWADSNQSKSCPQVWIETTPAFFKYSPADHTYVRVIHKTGKNVSWGCFGADKDGTELAETKFETHDSNLEIVASMANVSPCKWPKKYYASIGVCHQLSNRAIYHTKHTVYKARWYKISSFIFGTYGDCSIRFMPYLMFTCLDKADKWKPGQPPICEQNNANQKKEITYNEMELYDKSFNSKVLKLNKNKELSKNQFESEYEKIHQEYIDKLMDLYIVSRLGKDYPPEKRVRIKDIRNKYIAGKPDLDTAVINGIIVYEKIAEEYNKLYNNMLDAYRSFLTSAEFNALFGMDYNEKFDIGLFRPAE